MPMSTQEISKKYKHQSLGMPHGTPFIMNKKYIRRAHYSSKNFQDSTKKITENITLGYLLKVLFFNAFELGAESENQVFSNEEASSS
jgi:hypothetical protein